MRNELLLAGLLGVASVTGCSKPIPQPTSIEETVAKINHDAEKKVTHYNEVKPLIEDAICAFFGKEELYKIREYKVEIVPAKEFERMYPTKNNIEKVGILNEEKKTAYVREGASYDIMSTVAHEFGHILTTQDDRLPFKKALQLLENVPKLSKNSSKEEFMGTMQKRFELFKKLEDYRLEMHTRENLEKKLMEEAGAMAVERMVGIYFIEEYKMEVRFPGEFNHPSLHAVAACISYDVGDYIDKKYPKMEEYARLKKTWDVINTSHYGEIEEVLKPDTKKNANLFFKKNVRK